MGGTGGFSAGASRRCCLGRYFTLAGWLGCFSFLLPGQLLCWEIWDSWMLQEGAGGCPDTPPSVSVCSWRQLERSSLLQEFLAFPAPGRGSWDLRGWDLVASDPRPINPFGPGAGKGPSPRPGRIWVSSVRSRLLSLHFPPAAAAVLEQPPACPVLWPSWECLVSLLLWEGEMEINKVGCHCPPVMGSALRACLGMLKGKDLMSPRVPSMGLFPPFLLPAPLSARIRISFFSPPFFFCLPSEENSIVLFLVVTTWLLATTFILLPALPWARGDGWEWPCDARDAPGTSSPESRLFLWPLPGCWISSWISSLLG